MQRYVRGGLIALLLFVQGLTGPSYAQKDGKWQRVLIETHKPYDSVVRAVEALGGRVSEQFTYVDAIAAEVQVESVSSISRFPGVLRIIDDAEIRRPTSVNPIRSGTAGLKQRIAVTDRVSVPHAILSRDVTALAASSPQAYSINNAETRIELLHAMGHTGNGAVIAVIDTGIRRGFVLTDEAVIGGIDFADDGAPGPGGDGQADWKKNTNDPHGTFVAGLIAGKASFSVSGVLKSAFEQYAPGAIVNGQLPLIGTAPDARIYAVRVFGENPQSVSTLTSTILAAIEHVIEQRKLYDSTDGKKGLNIKVANLSLGVYTLAAGQSLLDTSMGELLLAGIVPVVSAGNVGPSALTTASPGSSKSAVTVGGTANAANERIQFEVQFATESSDEYYPGIGGDIRPFSGTEIAWFSSRGPNADGRMDPDIVASGVGNISQGYCPDQVLIIDVDCADSLTIASGTSFSAPVVSGIAAVLAEAFPKATATQIRNALIASGNIGKVEAYFGAVDRGRGLVDAYAAYLLLDSKTVPDLLPPFTTPWDLPVEDNIEQNPGLIVKSGPVTEVFTGLKPGARGEILYAVPPDTDRVTVRVRNVQMSGPQNEFFDGDRMFLYVHSARTSSFGENGNYLVFGEKFFGGEPEREFELSNPETGVMRITVNPDTLNAGQVNANVQIRTIPQSISSTRVIDDTICTFEIETCPNPIKTYSHTVNPGTTKLDFLLTWDHDWAHYPTSDLDLIVCPPAIPVANCRSSGIKDAATLASPERFSIQFPAVQNTETWTLLVNPFNVPTQNGTDRFRLRIKATP